MPGLFCGLAEKNKREGHQEMGSSWLSVTEPIGRLSFTKELVNSASFIQKQCLRQECPSLKQLSLRAVLLSIALGSWFQRCKPFSLRNHLPPLETLWQPCLLASRSSEAASISSALFEWFVSFLFCFVFSPQPPPSWFLKPWTQNSSSECISIKGTPCCSDWSIKWWKHHWKSREYRPQAQRGFLRTVAKSVNYSFFSSGKKLARPHYEKSEKLSLHIIKKANILSLSVFGFFWISIFGEKKEIFFIKIQLLVNLESTQLSDWWRLWWRVLC